MKRILKLLIPRFLVGWYHFALAWIGAIAYRFPSRSMIVIGVVGTRGKTTTANLIWSCLRAAGYKAGLTGTANIRIGDEERMNPYHMTMPGRFELQRLLSEMRRKLCRFAIIETPSEGVEQWRHKGIAYDVAALTTIYPEYLEAHGRDFERCKAMHRKIFASLSKQPRKILNGKLVPKIIIVNNDSSEKENFLQFPADKKATYAVLSDADYKASDIRIIGGRPQFRVRNEEYALGIVGDFNVGNALAAIATLRTLGIAAEAIQRGLRELSQVPGRMEQISAGQPFRVFVDYAHDAISLGAALASVRTMRGGGRVIALTGGQGGGRDPKKRPVMGKIAASNADFVIIANEDPYFDDPKMILEEIAEGSEAGGKRRGSDLFVFDDRREGIRKALSLAGKGDIVLIAGKGAEQSMAIGNQLVPWDDRVVAREELRQLGYKL